MQLSVNKHEYIFFKDNKITLARKASAICSLKNLQVLITPNCRGNHVITCYNVHEKNIAEDQDRRNFKSVRELFVSIDQWRQLGFSAALVHFGENGCLTTR